MNCRSLEYRYNYCYNYYVNIYLKVLILNRASYLEIKLIKNAAITLISTKG